MTEAMAAAIVEAGQYVEWVNSSLTWIGIAVISVIVVSFLARVGYLLCSTILKKRSAASLKN